MSKMELAGKKSLVILIAVIIIVASGLTFLYLGNRALRRSIEFSREENFPTSPYRVEDFPSPTSTEGESSSEKLDIEDLDQLDKELQQMENELESLE